MLSAKILIRKIKNATVSDAQRNIKRFQKQVQGGAEIYKRNIGRMIEEKEKQLSKILNFLPGILETPNIFQKISGIRR